MRSGTPDRVKVGDVFGRLTVTSEGVRDPQRRNEWFCNCSCTCGSERSYRVYNLVKGLSKSCGCVRPGNKTHGLGHKATFVTWCGMRQRCSNPRDAKYPDYGGRGIAVCSRWEESFQNFYEDMGDKPPGTSLERIDNEKGYSPDNCRWATAKEQANNRRNNRRVTLLGVTMSVTQWSDILSIDPKLVYQRLDLGMSDEDALLKPKRQTAAVKDAGILWRIF